MQIETKPKETKKLVPATMPDNISAADKAALLADWEAQAVARNAAIAKEYQTPTEPNLTLRFELKRFGKHWQAYAMSKNGKRMQALMPSVSLLSSALMTLGDEMYMQATGTNGKR